MKRLTWLVGPPGAGKTTWAKTQASPSHRIVELDAMLAPILEPSGIHQGVLHANGQLVQLIRELELRPENFQRPPLLVVAGLVPEEALFAGGPHEEIWLLLPPRERWERQLHERPQHHGSRHYYSDYVYAAKWYERFERWPDSGRNVVQIATPYYPELLGKISV
jgi:hypothetical protein